MDDLKIGVVGCAGHMGINLIRQIYNTPNCLISGGSEHISHPQIGSDIGKVAGIDEINLPIINDNLKLFEISDLIIDFTRPESTLSNINYAIENNTKLIIGTTGLTKDIENLILKASKNIPIVYSANMSIGINLLINIIENLSAKLPSNEFDIEILEMHHKNKIDAPSGTAKYLGEAAAKGRKVDLDRYSDINRYTGNSKRQDGMIGFASLRGGGVPGNHSVIFASDNERIEVSHIAQDRSLFAAGAVKAALWLKDKKPSLYSMQDVLSL